MRGVEELMRRLVDDHIELALDLAPSLELIEGERAVLEEALVNLAVAAGDALPAGGRVRIATASHDVSIARGERRPAAGRLRRAVAHDAGMGRRDRGCRRRRRCRRRAARHRPSGGVLTVEAVSDESLSFKVICPRYR